MKPKFWLILFAGILLLSVLTVLFLYHWLPAPSVAEIYQDGILVERIDLSALTEPREIVITDGDKENVILAEHGQISMQSANCPDRLCVRQGILKNSLLPIVCLPNKVTVYLRRTDSSLPDTIS